MFRPIGSAVVILTSELLKTNSSPPLLFKNDLFSATEQEIEKFASVAGFQTAAGNESGTEPDSLVPIGPMTSGNCQNVSRCRASWLANRKPLPFLGLEV